MSVTVKLTNDVPQFEGLFEGWAHYPLKYLKNEDNCDLQGYYLNDIQTILKDDDAYAILAEEKGEILGCAVFSPLPWESNYFKKRMGAIKYLTLNEGVAEGMGIAENLLNRVIETSKDKEVEFLFCKCSTNDNAVIHALESKGFLMMDTLLSIYYDFQSFPDISNNLKCAGLQIRLAGAADCDELMGVSRRAFAGHIGRYHNDKNIPNEMATGLYEQWLKSSCSGWADWIVVAEKEGRIAGYSVWKKPSDAQSKYGIDLVDYSIVAIDPDFQRQGLFGLLTIEGMKLICGNYRYSEGRTVVDNFGIQRGFTKLGWKVCGAKHSFHKWL